MGEDYEDLLSMFASMGSSRKIADVIKESSGMRGKLKPFHPIKSASLLSGLLTLPSLQANNLRIEMLIHLIMAYSKGNKEPELDQLKSLLNDKIGKTFFVNLEDPVEDVFVSNVITEEGNARVFEGIWESSDFYLQRILNILKTLPENQISLKLKREVYAITKLSEEIAERRHLIRFTQGGGQDKGKCRIPSMKDIKALSQATIFSNNDLKRLDISSEDFDPFIFKSELKKELENQTLDDSGLVRYPIVYDDKNWFVLLPNCLSVAIRLRILEWMIKQGYEESFDRQLANEYRHFFKTTPILGEVPPEEMPLPVQKSQDKMFLEFILQFDMGRYLQVIAIIDSIAGFKEEGLISTEPKFIEEYSEKINLMIKEASAHCRKQSGFRQGLTILVGCGYGRNNMFRLERETPDWLVEFLSAPDFETLAWAPEANPLYLWKLINYMRFLENQGISIANANGLLNLYGWWVDTDYLLIPNEIEFGLKPIHLMIPTDCLANIRKKVRQRRDIHALPLPNGRLLRVQRKDIDSYFPGEENKPIYASIEAVRHGELVGAWVGEHFIFWLTVKKDRTGLSRGTIFQIWDAILNWLERSGPLFEQEIQELNNRAVFIIIDLNETQEEHIEPVSEDILRSCLSISVNQEKGTIYINIRDPFLGGFRNSANIAERAIVRVLVEGMLIFAGKAPSSKDIDTLVAEIVPDNDVRFFHVFEASNFHDYIMILDHPKGIFIDGADEARSKIGLGWLVQGHEKGNSFVTSDQSTSFLNSVVDTIWERMRTKLRDFNRLHFIEQALRHIEGVEAELRQWRRTIRAVIALRDDKETTKSVAINQTLRCNASELALRILVEMAISECPLEGGGPVGKIDFTALMSDALFMFMLGGWSDAIKKGVMEPEIKIAPNGDILSHPGFHDEVYNPHGRHFESTLLDHENSQYDKYYEPLKPVPTMQGVFPDYFLTAFNAEFGLSIDWLRGTRDMLEDLAAEKKKCVFIADKNELISYCEKSDTTNGTVTEIFLDHFSLFPREAWDKTPKGFKNKDWYPWRFGRALSLVARPLIKLEDGDNPRYIISGLIAKGTTYTIARYYNADIETSDCHSSEMRRWIDNEKARLSHEFVNKVSNSMRAFGYQTEIEILVSALLNEKTDKNYGDIDVLAWKPNQGKVELLVIECKDLKVAKTPNEIAEQLNHFSGQLLPNGDRDELLKHMDRCAFLNKKTQRIAQMLNLGEHTINIKSIVCFNAPVPTQYMSRRFPEAAFLTIEELSRIVMI
jgi:hypothetical protein